MFAVFRFALYAFVKPLARRRNVQPTRQHTLCSQGPTGGLTGRIGAPDVIQPGNEVAFTQMPSKLV